MMSFSRVGNFAYTVFRLSAKLSANGRQYWYTANGTMIGIPILEPWTALWHTNDAIGRTPDARTIHEYFRPAQTFAPSIKT